MRNCGKIVVFEVSETMKFLWISEARNVKDTKLVKRDLDLK